MINYNNESLFFKSVQIDIEITIEIEMYQENKIEKSFLKILECSNFRFDKFIKRNIELTLSKMIL